MLLKRLCRKSSRQGLFCVFPPDATIRLHVHRTAFTILIALLPVLAHAQDSPQQILDNLALSITKADAKSTLDLFDPQAPGLPAIKQNIEALAALPDTNCAIAINNTTAAADTIQFETQWSLQTYPVQNGPLVDRRDTAIVKVRRTAGVWKITGIDPVGILAPPDGSAFNLVARLAADLNDKNESGILGAFDSKMKQYGEIDNDIDALVTQNDILCAIDIVSDRMTQGIHTLDLDWYLQLKSRADAGGVLKRRERVKVEIVLIRNKWKIGNITSLSVLSPAIDRQ